MTKNIAILFIFLCITNAAHAANTVITEMHRSFDVEDVILSKGDTIIFVNKDDVAHNLQITDAEGNNIDKGLQQPDDETKAVFDKPGEYKIRCAIYPKMKMLVKVK